MDREQFANQSPNKTSDDHPLNRPCPMADPLGPVGSIGVEFKPVIDSIEQEFPEKYRCKTTKLSTLIAALFSVNYSVITEHLRIRKLMD